MTDLLATFDDPDFRNHMAYVLADKAKNDRRVEVGFGPLLRAVAYLVVNTPPISGVQVDAQDSRLFDEYGQKGTEEMHVWTGEPGPVQPGVQVFRRRVLVIEDWTEVTDA